MSIWKQLGLGTIVVLLALIGAAALSPSVNSALRAIGLERLLDGVGLGATEALATGQAGGARGAGEAAMVVARAPGQAQIADRVTVIGDGRAARSVTVMPEAAGRVTEVLARSGQRVQAGEVLLRLDNQAEIIAVERSRLLLEDARAALDRLQQLQGSGASTTVQLREAELAVRQAELEVRQAEFDLSRREVVAPVSGWIGILNAELGTHLAASTPIADIDDRSMLLVDFRVPERLVGQVTEGYPVLAEALAGGAGRVAGVVSAVDNRVDPTSRTLRVQATLDNAEDRLRAGMSFEISLDLAGEPAPSVDPLSVQWNREGAFVWVVRDGKAERLAVRILQRSETEVLVDADFAPGDLVIVEGVQAVRPGAPVQLQPEEQG